MRALKNSQSYSGMSILENLYFRSKFYKKIFCILAFWPPPVCKWRELWETFWRRDWVAAINIIAEERAAIKRAERCAVFVFVLNLYLYLKLYLYLYLYWRDWVAAIIAEERAAIKRAAV